MNPPYYCPRCTCTQQDKKGNPITGHFIHEFKIGRNCTYCGGEFKELTNEKIVQCYDRIIPIKKQERAVWK